MQAITKKRNPYVLCATLRGAEAFCSDASQAVAEQPLARRLNRIERVADSFDGKITRRARAALLISFDSADHAVLAACEMQSRCADLPQVSASRLMLQIGVHKASPESYGKRQQQVWPNADRREPKRRFGFDMAGRLAGVAQEDAIIISDLVFGSLSLVLKNICRQVKQASIGMPVYNPNWQHAPTRQSLFTNTDFGQLEAASRLILRQDATRLELDFLHPTATLGRDPGCDMVVNDSFASRVHASVEVRQEGCVLTDRSANGTTVLLHSGMEVQLKNESYVLTGRGYLFFSQRRQEIAADRLEFYVQDAKPWDLKTSIRGAHLS